MSDCTACGKPRATRGIGGTPFCPPCADEVQTRVDKLRAEGRPVNVLRIGREIFRESHSLGSYTLRDIPTELWDEAKHRAIDDGVSLRELLLRALREHIKK
jgi:hypothetical protein